MDDLNDSLISFLEAFSVFIRDNFLFYIKHRRVTFTILMTWFYYHWVNMAFNSNFEEIATVVRGTKKKKKWINLQDAILCFIRSSSGDRGRKWVEWWVRGLSSVTHSSRKIFLKLCKFWILLLCSHGCWDIALLSKLQLLQYWAFCKDPSPMRLQILGDYGLTSVPLYL